MPKTKAYRKKIGTMGCSKGIVLPANWLTQNRLTNGDPVAMLVNNDYILIRDCKECFFEDLQPQEIELMDGLIKLREAKMVQVRKILNQADKELRETGEVSSVVDEQLEHWRLLRMGEKKYKKVQEYEKAILDLIEGEDEDKEKSDKGKGDAK